MGRPVDLDMAVEGKRVIQSNLTTDHNMQVPERSTWDKRTSFLPGFLCNLFLKCTHSQVRVLNVIWFFSDNLQNGCDDGRRSWADHWIHFWFMDNHQVEIPFFLLLLYTDSKLDTDPVLKVFCQHCPSTCSTVLLHSVSSFPSALCVFCRSFFTVYQYHHSQVIRNDSLIAAQLEAAQAHRLTPALAIRTRAEGFQLMKSRWEEERKKNSS